MYPEYESVNRRLLRELKKKPFLIATHRGTPMGTFTENTINAYKACFTFHSDMAEIDVIRNADGEYFCIHDGYELQNLNVNLNSRLMTTKQIDSLITLNKYNEKTGRTLDRFEDLLKAFAGTNAMFNLDRCWESDFSYTDGALKLIEKYNMYDQFVFKTPFNEKYFKQLEASGCPIPYIVIVSNEDQVRVAEQYRFNLVGFELIYKTEDDAIVSDEVLKRLHDKNYILMTGSEMISAEWNVSALHNDDRAVLEGPEAAWTYFVDKRFQIILTDIPWYMNEYRETLMNSKI